MRPYEGGNIRAYGNIVSEGTTTAQGGFVGNLTGSVTGNVSVQLTGEYWVDGARTDTYTADGSILYPFLDIDAALDVINAKVAISPRGSYVVHVAAGTYDEALTITGGPQYLRFEGYGVVISGAITYTPANDVYDKVEFVGAATGRSSKGPAMTISGKMNLVKSNDSLKYLGFKGCYVTGEIEALTNGTWVLEYQDCYSTGAIDGTLASFAGAQVPSILIETYGYNKFTGAITGIVSLYNCWDTEFACSMTTTPYFENRINNCRFTAGTISIIPKVPSSSAVIYGDANSLTSFKARTPTITGATYSNIDACGMLADTQTWAGIQTAPGIVATSTTAPALSYTAAPAADDKNVSVVSVGTWDTGIIPTTPTANFAALNVNVNSTSSADVDITAIRARADASTAANTDCHLNPVEVRSTISQNIDQYTGIGASCEVTENIAITSGGFQTFYAAVNGDGNITQAGPNEPVVGNFVSNHTGTGLKSVLNAQMNGDTATVDEVVHVQVSHGTATNGINIEKTSDGTALNTGLRFTGTMTNEIVGAGGKAVNTATTPQVTSSTAAPAVNATRLGDIHVDTSAKKIYVAVAVGSGTPGDDWVILN
jgi:hypothetical protein